MLEWFEARFGAWIWYDPQGDLLRAYEPLRFTLYVGNGLLVLLLVAVLGSWIRRRSDRELFHPDARRRIFPALLTGFLAWVAQYAVTLATYRADLHAFTDPMPSLARRALAVLSGCVALGIFAAGSYLLGLGNERLHGSFRPPTRHGVQLPRTSALLGGAPARWAMAVAAGLAVAVQVAWPAAPLGTLLDAVVCCAALTVFGLGLLRELNRERLERIGLAAASSMILYGVLQLGTADRHLFFWVYGLGIFLKLALALTLVGFRATVFEAERARQEEKADLAKTMEDVQRIEDNLSYQVHARHELTQPVALLQLQVRNVLDEYDTPGPLLSDLREIDDTVESLRRKVQVLFAADRPPGRSWPRVDLVGIVTGAAREHLADWPGVELDVRPGGGQPLPYRLPPETLQWTVRRIAENATAAGATRIRVDLGRDPESGLYVIRIANNGRPIPDDRQRRLFLGPFRGLWAARRLVTLLGGDVSLETSTAAGTAFRIVLPPREAEAGAGVEE